MTATTDSKNYNYQFVAGSLALDFVNTVAFRADPGKKKDRLHNTEDIYRWASQAELPDLTTVGSGSRSQTATLRRIRELREDLFAVFHAITINEPIPPDILAHIGNALQDCRAKRCLSVDGTDVRWTWRPDVQLTDVVLYPVLTAATDLLTSDSHGSIRQCEDAGCGWLFLDRSNARTRRWCSMADCGNRNKARRYYRTK